MLAINTPQIVNGSVSGGLDAPNIAVKAMHDSRTGTYTSVSVEITHPMIPVTPTLIRRLRLGAVRSSIIRQKLMEANPELVKIAALKSFFTGSTGRAVAQKSRLSPSAEQLDAASAVYRLARLAGDFPVKAVQRCFALEKDEAHLWVSLARRAGALA